MDCRDAFGLPITLEDARALPPWTAAIRAFLRHCRETPEHLSRTLELAPGFALGHAVKGLFTLLLGRAELAGPARGALARAEAALASHGGTAREHAYVAALRAYAGGRPKAATAVLAEILARHPGDALAVKLDHAIRFVLGDRRGMLEMARAALPAQAGQPMQGYVAGCLAFALEENGAYAEAERTGRAGLALAPDDAWGLHAVAHVYDMTARTDAGIAWLEDHVGAFAHCNNFGGHVWWHLALFHLDRGEHEAALALYDSRIRAEHTDDYRDIANGASMLMRLELEGVAVGDRWEELGRLAEGRVDEGCVVFADLHYLMALGGAGREAAAERLIARLAADAACGTHDQHEVAALAGHPAALGLAAFRAGDHARAFAALRSVRAELQKVGGSHAQRDVFSRLAIEAGLGAGDLDGAEAELRSRALRRGAADGYTLRRLEAIALRRAALAAE